MLKTALVLILCAALFTGSCLSSDAPAMFALQQQVTDTERAFAKSMAQRDFEAFVTFLSDEAVFFAGETPLRGKQVVADTWKPFYEGQEAPFSWEPEHVEVLESGTLALSSGPVFDPQGKQVATFNSVWRLESNGEWRIVFDKGNAACNCAEP